MIMAGLGTLNTVAGNIKIRLIETQPREGGNTYYEDSIMILQLIGF
jgi:hypothetical protein